MSAAQLSLPLDGRGARIRMRTEWNERAQAPSRVKVEIDGRYVTLPIEAVHDDGEDKTF